MLFYYIHEPEIIATPHWEQVVEGDVDVDKLSAATLQDGHPGVGHQIRHIDASELQELAKRCSARRS